METIGTITADTVEDVNLIEAIDDLKKAIPSISSETKIELYKIIKIICEMSKPTEEEMTALIQSMSSQYTNKDMIRFLFAGWFMNTLREHD